MASDGQPVKIPVTSLVHGSQAPTTIGQPSGGNIFAAQRQRAAAPAAGRACKPQVTLLNKYLNDLRKSPISFGWIPPRTTSSSSRSIPRPGAVIGEFPAAEFAELARSVGISGVLIDSHV